MKRILATVYIVAIIAIFAVVSNAQDLLINTKINTVTQKISKNGEQYVIFTYPDQRELNGVKYSTEISVFAFKNEDAKKLKSGDQVKAVVKKSVDRSGNEFHTLISLVK